MYTRLTTVLLLAICFGVQQDTRAADNSGLDFISIPAGEFNMGSRDLKVIVDEMPEPDRSQVSDETPAHRVSISQAFEMSTTEVTQMSWLKVMGSKPGPDSHWQHENWQRLPVVSVNWHEVQDYISKLNGSSDAYRYRLPTEAEWEYAARAGDTGIRPGSQISLDEYAWYFHTSNDEVQAVAQLKPNAWGLYDMLGNTWEWVSDHYSPDSYQRGAVIDPAGPATGDKRVRRGGSYHCQPQMVRYAYRAADTEDTAYSVTGFRLVRTTR